MEEEWGSGARSGGSKRRGFGGGDDEFLNHDEVGTENSRHGRQQQHTELYAMLHVARDASDDELTRAYRQLAGLYHPDKFSSSAFSQQMQEVAKDNFQRIRAAYEILSDPTKRAIYDMYGTQGLTAGLEVGPVLRTRDELREAMARAEQRRREAQIAMRTQHTSSLVLSVSAADAVAAAMAAARHGEWDKVFARPPVVMGMQMASQVQAQLSPSNTLAVGGSMLARRGAGGGSMLLLMRRQISPLQSAEAVLAVGLRSMLTLSTARQISPSTRATAAAAVQLNDGAMSITNTWTRQLTLTTTASMQVSVGDDGGGVVVGWQGQAGENNSLSADLKAAHGLSLLGLSGSWTRRFSEASQGRLGVRVGTTGVDVEIGGSRRMSENSAAGMSVVVGLQGVSWKIRFTRGGQKVAIPIVLTRRFQPVVALAALLLPSLSYYTGRKWLLGPWERRRRKHKEIEMRRATASQVREAMAEARAAQQLMAPVAQRKRQRQETSGGLVIVSAKYGLLRASPSSSSSREDGSSRDEEVEEGERGSGGSEGEGGEDGGERRGAREEEGFDAEEGEEDGLPPAVWDITVPLQFLVDESANSLLLHAGVSKRGLMGSCDPVPRLPPEAKQLRVRYSFRGKLHVVTIGDLEELNIPNPCHELAQV